MVQEAVEILSKAIPEEIGRAAEKVAGG